MCKHVSKKKRRKKKPKIDFTSHVNQNKTLINKKKKYSLKLFDVKYIQSVLCD